MVHELIGIKNNRVSLSQVSGITKELENLYSNFGEIATNIKGLMEHFQEKHKSQSKIESIGDMKVYLFQKMQFETVVENQQLLEFDKESLQYADRHG
ncbi:unnamed protein product [Rotaria magnacalcarata]|uniref:Uncharacterized protein n=1 Tax=Rotaria magnacalcarata TaxID=392030 RepID=A0A815JF30_9BILA|nr:unnamed protein product [Rotaria magnacalcarata]CAF3824165.1 unnamed protein product [Rotaria magnacalcarata]